jgi:4-hydroxyphenylacetate 3-monooxygenase
MPAPATVYAGPTSPTALAIAVPVATPGLKFVCRESFDYGRSPYDHPLGSRFEEMDCFALFDRVLVPWERVFILEDAALCDGLFKQTNAYLHAIHQFTARHLVKAELLLGLAASTAATIKVDQHLHVQTMLGELVDAVETLRALLHAAEADAELDRNGFYAPRANTMLVARGYLPRLYPRLVEILQLVGSSGLTAIPTEATVHSDVAEDVERYYQSATLGGVDRVRLFRLAWDAVLSSFGGRQTLYEQFFTGDPIRNMAARYRAYDTGRAVAKVRELLGSGD